MTFDEYQKRALTTVISNDDKFKDTLHWVLGINGEAGEVAEKVKKIIRDKDGVISDEDRKELAKKSATCFGIWPYLPTPWAFRSTQSPSKISKNCRAAKPVAPSRAPATTGEIRHSYALPGCLCPFSPG
jgi:hypothetical protein